MPETVYRRLGACVYAHDKTQHKLIDELRNVGFIPFVAPCDYDDFGDHYSYPVILKKCEMGFMNLRMSLASECIAGSCQLFFIVGRDKIEAHDRSYSRHN